MKNLLLKILIHLVLQNIQSTLFSLVEKRETEYSRLFNKRPDYLSVFILKILPNELDANEKQKIFVIVTSIGSNFVGKALTKKLVMKVLKKMSDKVTAKQVSKYIPFAGAVIVESISYGTMYSLGKSHVDDCFEVCKQILKE